MIKNRKVFICIIVCFFAIGFICISNNGKAATGELSKKEVFGVAKKNTVKIRKKPTIGSKSKISLKKGQCAFIIREVTKYGKQWYRVRYRNEKNKLYYGYVKSTMLSKKAAVTESNISYKGTAKESTSLYLSASLSSKKLVTIETNEEIKIVGRIYFGTLRWYKCKWKDNTGYVLKSMVSTKYDINFEEQLKLFPSSYRKSLRELHKEHPKWTFRAVPTGLDWGTVIKNETAPGLCTIESYYPKGNSYLAPFSYLSTVSSCYDWSKDKYTVFDGTCWYTAATSVVKYYMDPRNFLNNETIFQFKSFKYEKNESQAAVKNMLKDTFMKGTYTYRNPSTKKKVKRSYSKSFMNAGKIAGISPYFLASRARQEQGIKGSASIWGNYSGYKGYYNYYNVGANDSKQNLAIRNGLRFAKKADSKYWKPWNTPYKAIVGGAIYLAEGYIPVKQFTNYFQKFNVVNQADLYRHQYMSNVQAPSAEGYTMYKSCKQQGLLNKSYVFYIPTYINMPDEVCQLPSIAGNPNAYLKSISLENESGTEIILNEDFVYNTLEYSCNISDADGKRRIVINANPVSKYATIVSGTGDIELEIAPGETKSIEIVCKAQKGTKKTYKIKVTNTYS